MGRPVKIEAEQSGFKQLALPPITTALVLQTMLLEIQRDAMSWDACEQRFVGEMRRRLGHPMVERGAASNIDPARDGACAVLSAFCRVCPYTDCPMKRW